MRNNNSIVAVDRMLEYLQKRSQDRGLMADVRAGLRQSTQAASWPVIAMFCDLTKVPDALVYQMIAGLYAMHPIVCSNQSMGGLCRSLCDTDEGAVLDDEANISKGVKEGPISRRFRRLLDADSSEICDLVVNIVMLAKSKGRPVDYSTLAKDILRWGEAVKRKWAQDFWGDLSNSMQVGDAQ